MIDLTETDARYHSPKFTAGPFFGGFAGDPDAEIAAYGSNATWANADGTVTWIYPASIDANRPYGRRVLMTAAEWQAEQQRQVKADTGSFLGGLMDIAKALAPAAIFTAAAGAVMGQTVTAATVAESSAADLIAGAIEQGGGFAWETAYGADTLAAESFASIETAGTIETAASTAPTAGGYNVESLDQIFADTGTSIDYGWQLDYNGTITDGINAAQQLTQSAANASAGTGSLSDVFGNVTKTIKSAMSAVASIGASGQAIRNTRGTAPAAGRINLGMIALAGAAYFALKG